MDRRPGSRVAVTPGPTSDDRYGISAGGIVPLIVLIVLLTGRL